MSDIAEIIEKIPVLGGIVDISVLQEGSVNRIWKIEAAEKNYVLRQQKSVAKMIGLDLSGEFEILESVATIEAGPQPVWVDVNAGLLLLEYLPGTSLSGEAFEDGKTLARAGELLKRIHDTRPDVRKVDYAGFVSRYSAAADDASSSQLALEALELIDLWCGDDERLVLCHGDPLAQNFIAGPETELKLIDWEYSGLGEPCFDLAVIIHHHNLDKTTRKLICDVVQVIDAEARLEGCLLLYERILALWLMTCRSSLEESC